MSRTLGPFELSAPIGRGAQGEVWLARHLPTGEPAAVKWHASPDHAAAFLAEATAAARLYHPGVVRVLDLGTARAGEAGLPAGAPWLAMELLDGGPPRLPCASWPEAKRLLLEILDALAHAHARGVLHRDLKPANVLRGGPFGRHKLVDFGMAVAVGTRERRATGTPETMAPEQLGARWQDFGPATDLWAVGCLGWMAATRYAPFLGDSLPSLSRQILHRDPEPMRPLVPVPAGFEAWCLALLEKDPRRRCDRAAAAAHALLALGDAALPPGPDRAEPAPALGLTFSWDAEPSSPIVGEAPAQEPTASVPIPADWRPPAPMPMARMRAASLAVLGLQRPPLVGREPERTQLWELLRLAAETGSSTAAVLRGPAGIGRSSLGEWLAVRAHECGAATVWSAGLRDGLVAEVGLFEADRSEIERGLAERGLPDPDGVVGAWLAGGPAPSPASVGAVLAAIASRRPLLVRVHGDPDPLAEEVCALGLGSAVLWVFDTEPPTELHGAQEVILPPLDRSACRALLASLVPLSAAAEDELVAGAAGNPGALIGALTALSAAGRLRAGPSGLEVLGAAPRGDIDELRERGIASSSLALLSEWYRDASARGLSDSPENARGLVSLAYVLAMGGDLHASEDTFGLARAMAERLGDRWVEAYCVFLEGLLAQVRGDHRGAYRLYLDAAGRYERVGDPSQGFVSRVSAGRVLMVVDVDEAERHWRALLAVADLPHRRVLVSRRLAACAASRGQFDEAIERMHAAIARMPQVGRAAFVPAAQAELSGILSRAGRHDEAIAIWEAAAPALAEVDGPSDLAAHRFNAAMVFARAGRWPGAMALATACIEGIRDASSSDLCGLAELVSATAALNLGDPDRALAHLGRIQGFEIHNDQSHAATLRAMVTAAVAASPHAAISARLAELWPR